MKDADTETRRRIRLSIWAYAYEFEDHAIVSDAEFDAAAALVDLNQRTKNPDLDFWFVLNFTPDSGLWIHKHPDLAGIKNLYERHFS